MSDTLADYIELFHDYGVYIPTRTIEECGEIDVDMYSRMMRNLHILDEHKSGTITIKLNSEGGCLTSARGIYDAILGCKNHVRVIGYGELASAATIILQAADERVLAKNAKLMIHVGVESVPEDHPRNVDSLYNEHRIDETWIEDVYLKKIKEKKKRFTRQMLKDLLIFDKYLGPDEALELGLIDLIGEPQ